MPWFMWRFLDESKWSAFETDKQKKDEANSKGFWREKEVGPKSKVVKNYSACKA